MARKVFSATQVAQMLANDADDSDAAEDNESSSEWGGGVFRW